MTGASLRDLDKLLNTGNARHLFQLSGKRFSLEDDKWNKPPTNHIVFIGRNLKAEELPQKLAKCLIK
ncbi:MAG: GTP-binding protein [Potamolinea sp.]